MNELSPSLHITATPIILSVTSHLWGIERKFFSVVQLHFVDIGLPLMHHMDAMHESVQEDIRCTGLSLMGTLIQWIPSWMLSSAQKCKFLLLGRKYKINLPVASVNQFWHNHKRIQIWHEIEQLLVLSSLLFTPPQRESIESPWLSTQMATGRTSVRICPWRWLLLWSDFHRDETSELHLQLWHFVKHPLDAGVARLGEAL